MGLETQPTLLERVQNIPALFGKTKKHGRPEGTDFNKTNNSMHEEFLFSQGSIYQRKVKAGIRWLLLFICGMAVALMYLFMNFCIDSLQDIRMENLAENLEESYSTAWLHHFGFMIGLLLIASLLVLFEPAAGGGGIPEIIAYLNGIIAPRSFAPLTVLFKIFGTIFAVGSGIAIGPEAPTIHLGAALTLNIVQLIDYLFSKIWPVAGAFSNDFDRRLFMASGAAAGIACAFRAPIGGVFFAIEEAVTHFEASIIVRIYFMCVIAYYTLMIALEGHRLNTDRFTEYQLTTGCNAGYDSEDIFLFACLGALGGAIGGVFNALQGILQKFRKKYVHTHGWKKIAEVLIVGLITTTAIVMIPTAFDCTSVDKLVSHLPETESLEEYINLTLSGDKFISEEYCISSRLEDFCIANCSNIHHETLLRELDLRQSLCEDKEYYNQLESLLQGSGHKTVSLLFEEGTYEAFSYGPLFVFFLIYFVLATIASGSNVPAGLVIPMLTLGGTLGRIFALFVNDYIKVGSVPIDPGAWAQVGSAAVWCGSGRITATIAIITLEITGEYSYLPAIGIAVTFSKWVGDLISDGLYHMILHWKLLDTVGDVPCGPTQGASVADIMKRDPVTINELESCERIREILDCTHNGFPVVRMENGKKKMVGMVLRKYLQSRVEPCVDKDATIEVVMYMDPSPYTVFENMVAYQASHMFASLGLRHLPVVDTSNHLVGILTRKDFHSLSTWVKDHNNMPPTSSSSALNSLSGSTA